MMLSTNKIKQMLWYVLFQKHNQCLTSIVLVVVSTILKIFVTFQNIPFMNSCEERTLTFFLVNIAGSLEREI